MTSPNHYKCYQPSNASNRGYLELHHHPTGSHQAVSTSGNSEYAKGHYRDAYGSLTRNVFEVYHQCKLLYLESSPVPVGQLCQHCIQCNYCRSINYSYLNNAERYY